MRINRAPHAWIPGPRFAELHRSRPGVSRYSSRECVLRTGARCRRRGRRQYLERGFQPVLPDASLPGAAFDEERILSNDGELRIAEVPSAWRRRLGRGRARDGSVWRRSAGCHCARKRCRPSLVPRWDERCQGGAEGLHEAGPEIQPRREITAVNRAGRTWRWSYTDAKGARAEA